MSVTVPYGAQEDAGSTPGKGRAQQVRTLPAVIYLAAAQNTYGTLSYRRALRRVADEWPLAVVMDADACGFASRAKRQACAAPFRKRQAARAIR